MSGSKQYSALVRVVGKFDEDGRWTLTSPDLPGFLLRGSSLDMLFNHTPESIRMLYELNYGMRVTVSQAVSVDQLAHPESIKPGPEATFAAVPVI